GIATSGTTPYVHGALERARERGARTGFLLCTSPSDELVERHDVVIAPLVGPEVVTGSTRMKAGTATKLVLNTITTTAMVRLGKVHGNLMVDLQVTCRKLRDRGERILMETLGLPREAAAALLDRAEGHVKTAIVMHRLGVDRDEAATRLEAADGVIARVAAADPVGPPDSGSATATDGGESGSGRRDDERSASGERTVERSV
ncbi:MAG: N-acetylmuramic acid 6-phosphate etherase, partial [Gemmatimonadota bacterium]